jgi:hypothetical protein|tara:strand:- start:84 stop:482 length:399 start_codon:yes stop_codon:yes gene_type:complete
MEKYLYFNSNGTSAFDEANKCYCVPVSKFRGFNDNVGSTDNISMFFAPAEGNVDDANVSDIATLSITVNKQKEVIEAILAAIDAPVISGHGKSMIVIADAPNSEFLSVDPDSSGAAVAITGVSLTIQAGAAS